MAAMLEFDHVHFGYGRAVILPDLSFTIEKGDMVALIGANGAGKSTVSRLCNGLLLPSKGHVRVSGMDTKKVRTSALAKKIGFLFQNPGNVSLCPVLFRGHLRETVEMAPPLHGLCIHLFSIHTQVSNLNNEVAPQGNPIFMKQ